MTTQQTINPFDITGKTVIITGAGSGLGASAAKGYARAGARLALWDINTAGLATVAADLENEGPDDVIIQTVDVSNLDQVGQAVNTVAKRFGGVDILLNDAGTFGRDSVEDFDPKDGDRVFSVNLGGVRNTSHFVIPLLKEKGYGKIINIASAAIYGGKVGETSNCDTYFASKNAVAGLTRAMATRLAKYGIGVNAVAPGLFKTGITADNFEHEKEINEYFSKHNPTGRYGREGDLNGTLLFLSSHASDYVIGQTIFVDGGHLLALDFS